MVFHIRLVIVFHEKRTISKLQNVNCFTRLLRKNALVLIYFRKPSDALILDNCASKAISNDRVRPRA